MSILDFKKNLISRSKMLAKKSAIISLAVFVISFIAGVIIPNGSVVNFFGNISVLGMLFFALSVVCLFLIQIEAWEKEQA